MSAVLTTGKIIKKYFVLNDTLIVMKLIKKANNFKSSKIY